jgi:hypothetical protein
MISTAVANKNGSGTAGRIAAPVIDISGKPLKVMRKTIHSADGRWRFLAIP